MNLIVCVDDRWGMMFNRRRQSRDRMLYPHIFTLTQGAPVYARAYSIPLFSALDLTVRDIDRERCSEEGFFFAEEALQLDAKDIQKVIIYRWNRSYPADVYFPAQLLCDKRLTQCGEFSGYSHEKISWEVYQS